VRPLFGECFINEAEGRGLFPWIGGDIEPMPKLGIQIIKIAE
jgi:hypothetical protein